MNMEKHKTAAKNAPGKRTKNHGICTKQGRGGGLGHKVVIVVAEKRKIFL